MIRIPKHKLDSFRKKQNPKMFFRSPSIQLLTSYSPCRLNAIRLNLVNPLETHQVGTGSSVLTNPLLSHPSAWYSSASELASLTAAKGLYLFSIHPVTAQFHQHAQTLQASKVHFGFPVFRETNLIASLLQVKSTLEVSL